MTEVLINKANYMAKVKGSSDTQSEELTVALSAEQQAQLAQMYPQEQGYTTTLFPRISFRSQDVMEGKGKDKKVTIEAGTFFFEQQTDELNEHGKKVWSKEEVGKTISLRIIYVRKQLRYYDESTEEYTSSPLYDTAEEVVPLFTAGKKIAEGTPASLRALYEYKDAEGKTKSKLEETRVLYVMYKDTLCQLSLRGSSMYSFLTYSRATQVNVVVTAITSEEKEKGTINWNQMVFTNTRALTPDEATEVIATVGELLAGINDQKAYFASQKPSTSTVVAVVEEDF